MKCYFLALLNLIIFSHLGEYSRKSVHEVFLFEAKDQECRSEILDFYKKRRGANYYKFQEVIGLYSDLLEVDRDLIFAMAIIESGLKTNALSWVGARGLLQIMPETEKELFRTLGIKKNNLHSHVYAATYYFKSLKNQFFNKSSLAGRYVSTDLSIMAYNMGPGWTSRRIQKSRPIYRHRYVDKVKFFKELVTRGSISKDIPKSTEFISSVSLQGFRKY